MVKIFLIKVYNKCENAFWTLYRGCLVVCHFPRSVKWFMQRGYRGWADCDVWDMDEYLADVICEMLVRFRSSYTGCPSDLAVTDKDGKNNCDSWGLEIDKMIEGFMAAKSMKTGDYYDFKQEDCDDIVAKYKGLEARFKDGGERFIKYFNHLWD